jgi:hypothetical protein
LHVLYQLPIVCPDAGADSVGFDALASKPDAFAAQIKRELASWRAVIQDAKSKHPRRLERARTNLDHSEKDPSQPRHPKHGPLRMGLLIDSAMPGLLRLRVTKSIGERYRNGR